MGANIQWHKSQVEPGSRCMLLGQEPLTIWLTGFSGAGKSTLGFALEGALIEQGYLCFVLDGDNVRHGLNRDLGFSTSDRQENIRRIAEVAKLMNSAGLIVISSFISPYREDREAARQIIGKEFFREVYVSTSLDECERRDVKGLYQKARAGIIQDFTGISAPYEPPLKPDLEVETTLLDIDESVRRLLLLINDKLKK